MKKNLFIYVLIALLGAGSQLNARNWWPSEPWCKFINKIEMDRTWKFDTSIDDNNAGGKPNVVSDTQYAPGFICLAFVTYDDRCNDSDDYELDWCQLALYNKATSQTHLIARMDFLPEGQCDGCYNVTENPSLYCNYNGCETRFCKRRFYGGWSDGLVLCFFNIRYSESTREFIESAGANLQFYMKGRWDDEHWKDFDQYSYWTPAPFLEDPEAPSEARMGGFEEQDGKTMLAIQVPATEGNTQLTGELKADNRAIYTDEKMKLSVAGTVNWDLDKVTALTDWDKLNNGEYYVELQRVNHYPQDRSGYDNEALKNTPSNIDRTSDIVRLEIPQLRLAKNVTLKNTNKGEIIVSWEADRVTPGRRYADGAWVIERCTDGFFNSNNTERFTVDYDKDKTSYSFTDAFPQRQQGEVYYHYRIRRDYEITRHGAFCKYARIYVQTNYAMISSFVAKPQGNNAILSWTLSNGIWTDDMSLELRRGDAAVSLPSADKYQSSGTHTFTNFPTCTPTTFSLRVAEGNTTIDTSSIAGFLLPNTVPSVLDDFRQSKGFYNDHVDLNWTVNPEGDNFHHFIIKRKELDEKDKEYKTLETVNMRSGVLQYRYTDATAVAGVLYTYMLEGWTSCDDTTSLGTSLQGVGYAQPYGVVNGQVLFENGQAVQDVVVEIGAEDSNRNTSLEMSRDSYLELSKEAAAEALPALGGTVEVLVRLKDAEKRNQLFTIESALAAYIEGHSLNFMIQYEALHHDIYLDFDREDVQWIEDGFNHIAVSYERKSDSLYMAVYVNGKQFEYVACPEFSAPGEGEGVGNDVFRLGYVDAQRNMEGYITEVRLWKRWCTSEEMARRYDCLLNGKEEGLSGYYRCDRVVRDQVYDISGDGTHFNEHHMTCTNATLNTFVAPTSGQLAMRARTDQNGNYLINCVNYTKEGTLYSIVARKGIHSFKPATKTLFFDRNASTHNNVDFTDISTFTVSGTIAYAGGTYPVEGVMFKVDGVMQNSKKGEPIKTDSEGHFELAVPVGTHTVQAFMDGHRLTHDGWITNVDGSDIDYQRDYSGIEIYDSTRVRFIGRVCGGEVQKALPVGYTLSRNNLGNGIKLLLMHNHPDKYKLASKTWSDTLHHQTPSIYTIDSLNPQRKAYPLENAVDYSENFITIHVNDSTGEFYADVFPINYTVQLTVPFYPQPEEHGQQISFLNMTPRNNVCSDPYIYRDSLAIPGVTEEGKDTIRFSVAEQYVDSVSAAKSQVFCIRVQPDFQLTQLDENGNALPYYGVDSIQMKVDGENRMVAIYDATRLYRATEPDQDSIPYTMGAPMYIHSRAYLMKAKLAEIYRKYGADGDTAVLYVDTVPTTDGIVEVHNTLSLQEKVTFGLDSTGTGIYAFTTTEPNFSSGQGKISATVRYNKNKSVTDWQQPFHNNGFCFYTGSHKKGGDFITAGPNNLITILRDPPGTGSYSYLEKGTTIKRSNNFSWKVTENGKLGINVEWGLRINTIVGIGFMIGTDLRGTNSHKMGWQHDHTWDNTKSQDITYTSTQRYATGSDEVFVGANADVFVGTATNYSLATADHVQMVDSATYNHAEKDTYTKCFGSTSDGAFKLVSTSGIAMGSQFATEFVYTQKDIIHEEIPRLEKILHTLLVPYSAADSVRLQNLSNEDRQMRYMCHPGITSSSPNYAEDGTYYRIVPDTLHLLEKDTVIFRSDSVMRVKGWIDDWKYYLGMNEYQKWKAIQSEKPLIKNYSVSGGTTLTFTNTYQTALSNSYTRTVGDYFFMDNGAVSRNSAAVAFFGITILAQEQVGTVAVRGESTSVTTTHTKGFVLAPNGFERLSVDVLHEADWTESQETGNLPEWKDDGSGDAGSDDTRKVEGKISQLESFPSFIFYTRGGQTCCPYEPQVDAKYMEYYIAPSLNALRQAGNTNAVKALTADSAKIYGKTAILNQSTLVIDQPRIEVVNDYVDGVPSGEAAYIKIRMSNESESGTDRAFWLTMKESSNPNGASLVVDGTGIGTGLTGGSGVSYLIPAGTTLEKTIAVTKGSVLDYENLTLYMLSYCNTLPAKQARMDSCSFSVHFTPACSGIAIKSPGNNWVYNTELDSAVNPASGKKELFLPIVLHEFDVNYDEFDHIEIQFKPSSDSESRWRKLQYFYKDSTALKAAVADGKDPNQVAVCKGGVIHYNFFMDDLDDQQYDVRAVTFCRNGNEFVENYSDAITGVKDTYKPRLFGAAKPANGILTMADEIELEFNEEIAGGKLTYNNFTVTGVLDEGRSSHDVSVHMQGNSLLRTEAPFHITGAFTLEAFFRQIDNAGEQTLFEIGQGTSRLALVLNEAAHTMSLTFDKHVYNVALPAQLWEKGNWNHVAVALEDLGQYKFLHLYLNYRELTLPDNEGLENSLFIYGPLTVGKNYIGDVHQLRVWNEMRTSYELSAMAQTRISNAAVNLLSCYNMDENHGTTLTDVSGSRTMLMEKATWTVPAGRALRLDGQSYARIPLSENSIKPDEDYTLEFWFRTESEGPVTFLTTGMTDNELDKNGITIGLDKYGYVVVVSGVEGYTTVGEPMTYCDNVWHNFTLSAGRSHGFARVYIDGVLMSTISQEKVGGLAGSALYLGAMANTESAGGAQNMSYFMKGEIDELMLTKLYRTQFQVEQFYTQKTDSAMIGLQLYYPFEKYVTSGGISSLMFSLDNQRVDAKGEKATVVGVAGEATPGAPVATGASMTRLDKSGFTFTPSDKGVILTLTKPLARIEHTILTFTAEEVRDVHGNKMLSPVTWSAYVDRNPLIVDETEMVATVFVNDVYTDELVITNRSGAVHHFKLEGIPAWMDIETCSGSILPLEQKRISFSTSETLPIGMHTAHLFLSNSDDVVIPITLTVIVEGEAPSEDIDTKQFPYSMNIMGQIRINGVFSTDTRDIVQVYSNGELVGSAHTTYYKVFDAYYVNLTVYSRALTAQDLRYIIYDASTGRSYLADSQAAIGSFQNEAIIGSPASPVIFYNTTDEYATYHLEKGWNWISLNRVPKNGAAINKVLTGKWTREDLIKLFNAAQFADYNDSTKSWKGSLQRMDSLHLYKIYCHEPRELDVLGVPLSPAEVQIPIMPDWNGISFIPNAVMEVKEAMSKFWDVENDDVIRSQTQFAIYYNGEWVGSLKSMRPGEGYMLKHNGRKTTLTYPAVHSEVQNVTPRRAPLMHEHAMCLIARAEGVQVCEGDELSVYAGDELVGKAPLTDGVWYIHIAGDADKRPLCFRLTTMDGTREATTAMLYEKNAVVGSPAEPAVIRFAPGRNIESADDDSEDASLVRKVILDNQVYIIKQDQWFDLLGTAIK